MLHILWISSSFVLCSEVNTLYKCFSLINSQFLCWMDARDNCYNKMWFDTGYWLCVIIDPDLFSPLQSFTMEVNYRHKNMNVVSALLERLYKQSLTSVALWSEFSERVIPLYDAQEKWFSTLNAVCGVMLLVGLSFQSLVCIEMVKCYPLGQEHAAQC